jgi:isorenieratene synthase
MALLRRTGLVKLEDLRAVDTAKARQMLRFDPVKTYAEHDAQTAREYLDSLGFPEPARRVLFGVFARSSFQSEEELSAAEMLMRFHFYFLGNPEGLVFDVLDEPFSDALWKPMERYLARHGVEVELGAEVDHLERIKGGVWRVSAGDEVFEGEGVVLAVTVPALQAIVRSSPDLSVDAGLERSIEELGVAPPFAVWRLFLDRPADEGRPPFAGTSELGILDGVALYERLEGESRRWSLRTGGSVVELHARACATRDEATLRRALRAALDRCYPELADAEVLHDSWLLRQDGPSFAPGTHRVRPRVATPYGNVVLAGDFVKLPFPTAQMERAAASGMLAANHLLDRWDVIGDSIHSVPPRGFMAW